MKKILAIAASAVLAASMVVGFAGCQGGGVSKDEIKVGFIFLHDETSTYDKNFIDSAKEAAKNLGLKDSQIVLRTNVPEDDDCYEAAADLADSGCDVVFADSFGHESYILKAAREFPDVEFCHATGTQAHTAGVDNFHNAFAEIYEGRYLAGIAAGMKLEEMIEDGKITAAQAKMGYVGAFPYAEVISGFTSFYLGAKSVVPEVTMTVRYTSSWYDEVAEKNTANSLINEGCVLISQHADSLGAPSACEEAGVPNVSYNGSTKSTGPNTYIISSRINWTPYFEYMINCVLEGKDIATDWVGTLETNSVQILDLNTDVAAEGTQEKLDEVMAQLKAGTLKVFNTDSFTVKGEKLDSYLADVDDAGDYVPETEAISGGYFHESEYRSAPYFDIIIDGITSITT